ncbi:MAG: hypothetical protein PWP23_96 [Candidatus Sumerlaeota bacterium]|nr:hypothetical protein [Candidatus Sumerlaeota bacterium]
MPLKPSQLLDPIPESRKYFRKRLSKAPIDFESFGTLLKPCTMGECCGMCCYDGVCLDEDEEHYVGAVVDAHPLHFKELGITRENAFEDAIFIDTETRKTRTKKFKYPEHVNFPKHFDKTSCVFRYDDGRCSLQALAMEHGEHPWAYKPVSCWLHPISLERHDKTVLWLPTMGKDHLTDDDFPGYAPYTRCGCAFPDGQPAYEVLSWELETLGAVVGRDFLGEIRAYFASRPAASPDQEEAKKPRKNKKDKKEKKGKRS